MVGLAFVLSWMPDARPALGQVEFVEVGAQRGIEPYMMAEALMSLL